MGFYHQAGELEQNSVIKEYLSTAADGKEYKVTFYSLNFSVVITSLYQSYSFEITSDQLEKAVKIIS